MQAKVEVRLEQLKNAAQDLANELGVKLEFVQIKVDFDYSPLRQATELHTLLQDHLDFRLEDATKSIYKKDELIISHTYGEDGEQ